MNDHKAQLIIRTKDDQDAEVLENLKAIAQATDVTISEMALEFIKSGMVKEGFQLPAKQESVEEVLTKLEDPSSITETSIPEVNKESTLESLLEFFDGADPKEAHSMKQDLQKGMSKSEYQSLMTTVKKSPQYEAYRKRALSQLNDL